MLKRIVIKHYRSCESTAFDCHPQLSVLIGPNSSGKTNILQAILFLNKMATVDEYEGVRRQPANVTSSNLIATFETKGTNTQLYASIDAYTDDSNNDSIINATQRWRMRNTDGHTRAFKMPLFFGLEGNRGWHTFGRDMHRRQLIYRHRIVDADALALLKDSPSWASESFSKVAKYCFGIRYYSASQFTNPGACPVSFEIEKEGPRRRPLRIRGHAQTLYDIFEAQKASDTKRYVRFMDIVGPNGLGLIDKIIFKEIKASSVDVTARVGGRIEKVRRDKVLVVPQFHKGGEILSPNQLSEGTFKTLALLFNIITDDSTALLIEEPEVCVHQGLLSSILELIKQYSVSKQMFVTTHSDYVLDHVQPENVFKVKYDKKSGTEVRHIRKAMTKREYSTLRHYLQHEGNLGDYWREGALEVI
jgi:energy-coupling factor transporter ATP-binding protein EcfA2